MTAVREQTDEELMLAAKNGSIESFETLVARYRDSIIRFVFRKHPDIELAEDVCQEAFVRAWLFRERYSSTGKFSAYITQIARRVLLNKLERLGIETLRVTDNLEEMDNLTTEPQESPEMAMLREERHDAVLRCLETLPSHLSDTFTTVVIEGCTYAETSEILGIPMGTVKSRMHEAVKKLKEALSKEDLI